MEIRNPIEINGLEMEMEMKMDCKWNWKWILERISRIGIGLYLFIRIFGLDCTVIILVYQDFRIGCDQIRLFYRAAL